MQGSPIECPLPAGTHVSAKTGTSGNGPTPLSRDNLTRNSASLTGVSDARLLLPEDSWVEVSSRPSTSSMSSSSAGDEEGIVTMGLRVQQQQRQGRRRRAFKSCNRVGDDSTTATEAEKAGETYQHGYQHGGHEDEDDNDNEHETSSSDSDHAMSSSTEDLASSTSRDMFFLSRGNSTTSSSASASVISSDIDEYDNDDDDEMDEDDSDDNTALGPTNPSYTRVEGFKPRPHAFSHFTNSKPVSSPKPQQQQHRSSRPNSTSRFNSQTIRISGPRSLPTTRGPRLAASIVSPSTTDWQSQCQQQQHHLPPSAAHPYAPRNQDDYDAALRASLSTLLSCARGLSSSDVVPQQAAISPNVAAAAAVVPAVTAAGAAVAPAPGALRLVPESVAMARRAEEYDRAGGRGESKAGTMKDEQVRSSHTPTSRQQSPASAKKRSASLSAPRNSSRQSKRRQSPPSSSKRRRTSSLIGTARIDSGTTAHHQLLSPSLLTYLVGAGAIIVFSALSFSAGFVLGCRVGRLESCSFTGFETGGNTSASAAASAAAVAAATGASVSAGVGLRDAANEEVRSAVRGIGRGCKREAAKGIWELRRFGWLGAGTGITEIASA
ncbi:hypothetical protein KEM54_005067 [Ascosphaera aggregata]|nr:hypothetical protein KEM54_005067 [Ascosphaera aggregata]